MEKKYFDESIYLSGDKEAIAEILRNKADYASVVKSEKLFNESVINQYNAFMLELRNLFLELKLETSIETLIALHYLIKCGYLSIGKKFKREENPDDLIAEYGLSIIGGNGCCRNITGMGHHLLTLLDFYSKKLYVYKPNLSLPKNARLKEANHVINLIEDAGRKYGFDSTLDCELYRFKNSLTLQKITYGIQMQMRYKPYREIITGDSSLEDVKRFLKEFGEESKMPTMTPMEYEDELRKSTIAFMRENKALFDDFYDEVRPRMESMILTLNRI